MKVEIERSNGIRTYEVPYVFDTMTVMDILDYIYYNLDHTLAYYKHSTCNQMICGRCTVKLDGKPVLSCAKLVEPTVELIKLSPATGTVIRDLVVENRG